jgi:hypothetical protein
LENGSGEVLTAARAVILVAWLVAARLPPTSAAIQPMAALSAPSVPAASAAPAGMRMKVCTASQTESTKRDLVGEELDEQHEAAGRQHARVLQHLQAGRQRIQPR